jgi:ligand-binding sensor domain-containing protein
MVLHNRKDSLAVNFVWVIVILVGCTLSVDKTGKPEGKDNAPGIDVPTCTGAEDVPLVYSLPGLLSTGNGYVASIAISSDNVQWVATSNGILRFENGEWSRFTSADGLGGNAGASIQVAPDGVVWVLTEDGPLYSLYNFDGQTWRKVEETGVNERPNYASNHAGMVIVSNGDVWAVGNGGIFSFDGENWKHHTPIMEAALTNSYRILALAAGPDGTIWFSAMSFLNGKFSLLHYDGSQWSAVALPDMPEVNYPDAMTVSPDGSVWIGGNMGEAPFGSLAHYDGKDWKVYSRDNGLADDYIDDIVAVAGGVWFVTPRGIHRFDGKTDETIVNIGNYSNLTISPTGEVWAGGQGMVAHIPCIPAGNSMP